MLPKEILLILPSKHCGVEASKDVDVVSRSVGSLWWTASISKVRDHSFIH
jgi:hypothetical protein